MASSPTDRSRPTVRLDVTLPADAAANTQRIDVAATAGGAIDRPAARHPGRPRPRPARSSLTTDFPELKGTSTTAFTFNLTLHNDTAEDLTFGGTATAPARLERDGPGQLGGQAASAIVKAGSTTPVTVKASRPTDVAAGSYPIARGRHERQPERRMPTSASR